MAATAELESAFDAAITQARHCIKAGMTAIDGEAAAPHLRKLEEELKLERARALERGAVDREWFQKTLRWLVEWVPETELTLVAALGRIARAAPRRVAREERPRAGAQHLLRGFGLGAEEPRAARCLGAAA